MFRKLYQKYFINSVATIIRSELSSHEARLKEELDILKIQNGRILSNQMRSNTLISNIVDAEFKVFSQWDDDGIIQFIIHKIGIKNTTFIEFGVENYRESNTRFLLMNDNWKGLIIDGDQNNMDFVKSDPIFWRYDLTAVCSFITKENINSIFIENGFKGDIGILSIDVDGNDYWIWDNIDAVSADLVIVEYNAVFGGQHPITVPYDPSFVRSRAHYSNLYWGTSLKALCILAKKKGYIFIGCNSHGNNAYFVRKDKAAGLKELSSESGFVESKFRESRTSGGVLNFIGHNERIKQIEDMPVFNIETNKTILIKDLF
jgi:hypothetical protein